jgi:hypothetical protein
LRGGEGRNAGRLPTDDNKVRRKIGNKDVAVSRVFDYKRVSQKPPGFNKNGPGQIADKTATINIVSKTKTQKKQRCNNGNHGFNQVYNAL